MCCRYRRIDRRSDHRRLQFMDEHIHGHLRSRVDGAVRNGRTGRTVHLVQRTGNGFHDGHQIIVCTQTYFLYLPGGRLF